MSDGKGKLAEALAEAIVEKMGFQNEKDMNIYLDIILTAMQRIEKRLSDENGHLWENSYRTFTTLIKPEFDLIQKQNILLNQAQQKYLETFLIQFAKFCVIAAGDGGKKTSDTNPPSGDTSPSELAENIGSEIKDESENGLTGGKNSLQKSINRIEAKQNKIIQAVDSLQKGNRHIRTNIEDSEKRMKKHTVKMERSIKRTIKSRMGKLWSMFKKTLIVGLLLFFSPVIKNAFSKLADLLSPVTDWFKDNFPKLYDYIKDLSAYVGSLASDFKFLVDKIKGISGWADENSTNIGVGAGALTGAALGAKIGTMIAPGIGTAIGGLIGTVIGGAGAAIAIRANAETDEEQEARLNAEAEKNQTNGRTVLRELYADEIKRVIPNASDAEISAYTDEYIQNAVSFDLNDSKFEKTVPEQFRRLSRSGKYEMSAENWAKYKKSNPNSNFPTWDEWQNYMDSETSADEQESVLNGQTTVEPSDDNTGNNSISYNETQNTFNNFYNINASDTLWTKA